jgi:hypothetical protein
VYNESNGEGFAYHQLVETLRLLAVPAAEQRAALPPHVLVPDELAFAFVDACRAARPYVGRPWLPAEGWSMLQAIDARFAELTDAPDEDPGWAPAAIEEDERWEAVRQLARAVLDGLGQPVAPPVLDWIDFGGEVEAEDEL